MTWSRFGSYISEERLGVMNNDQHKVWWLKASIVLTALAAASLLMGSMWLAHAMDEGLASSPAASAAA